MSSEVYPPVRSDRALTLLSIDAFRTCRGGSGGEFAGAGVERALAGNPEVVGSSPAVDELNEFNPPGIPSDSPPLPVCTTPPFLLPLFFIFGRFLHHAFFFFVPPGVSLPSLSPPAPPLSPPLCAPAIPSMTTACSSSSSRTSSRAMRSFFSRWNISQSCSIAISRSLIRNISATPT